MLYCTLVTILKVLIIFFNTELHIFILSQGPQMMESVLYSRLGEGMTGKAGALLGKDLECHLDICSVDNEGSLKVFEHERYRVTVDFESHMRKGGTVGLKKERWEVVRRLL